MVLQGWSDRAVNWVSELLDEILVTAQDWVVNNLPEIILGLVFVAVGYKISQIASRYAGRPIYQMINRPSIARTAIRLIRYGIFIFFILIAIRMVFDVTLTSFLLTATVFSAVTGIILAPLVGDIISGVFVLGDQPYEIGDMIELVDTQQIGYVDDVTIRYTKIFTIDNTFLIIPNSEIRKRDVNNYSAEDVRTRQTVDITISYQSNLSKAMEALEEAAEETPEVMSTRGDVRIGLAEYPIKPTAFIVSFGDHGIQLRLRYWIREPFYMVRVKSKVNSLIWRKFQENDIVIPYPQRHHVFSDTTGELNISMDGEEET